MFKRLHYPEAAEYLVTGKRKWVFSRVALVYKKEHYRPGTQK